MKKSILIVFLGLMSSSVSAQTAGECNDVVVTTISAGVRLGAIVRVDNPNCGRSGWICMEPNDSVGITQDISDKVYALAIAAKATGDSVNIEWSDERGCGVDGFPYVSDFRVFN